MTNGNDIELHIDVRVYQRNQGGQLQVTETQA